ncbi:response regulator [Polymorphobacter multimanifer]|uniref:response regulator n=1 Tax=Polymorphobacter multimanifer TaxID=1070431 RepID=UPI001614A811|nr:response regulator [Polymorphobacter multimanifer]
MSMRAALGPHLPPLRRYARALTGAQRRGDAYVRLTLETILIEPEHLPGSYSADDKRPKLALFRLFHSVLQTAELPSPSLPATEIYDMPPGGMEALLLTVVEGFSLAETAFILDETEEVIAGQVSRAKAAIAETIRSRVLIIEDEPLIAMHLEQIVEDMGHEVSGMAMTHEDATIRAHEVLPELVLADIQLADGSSGLDAAREILETFDVPVIFITAYPERLLTGERPEPAYLVTKPFKAETVIATIGQALMARSFKRAETN